MISGHLRAAVERARFRIAHRARFDVDLLNAAPVVEELHPAATVVGPPCISLARQYERVRGCAFGIDIAAEIAVMEGAAPRRLQPTLRYELRDVFVTRGALYRRGRRKLFKSGLHGNTRVSAWKEYDEIGLRSSFIGCHFFGDWLCHDCATHLLAEQVGTPMSMPTPAWPDRAAYVALFGQAYAELDEAHVSRLVLFDDITHNAHKAERFRALRAGLAGTRLPAAAGRIVYLKRGVGGQPRKLLNEAEIVESLVRRGVVVMEAEALNGDQKVTELLGARMVVGIEGSQLSHALYTLRDGGGVLAIQPPDRLFNAHMDWARLLNMRYGVVVGEERPSGFHLPADDLLRTIDLMDAQLA